MHQLTGASAFYNQVHNTPKYTSSLSISSKSFSSTISSPLKCQLIYEFNVMTMSWAAISEKKTQHIKSVTIGNKTDLQLKKKEKKETTLALTQMMLNYLRPVSILNVSLMYAMSKYPVTNLISIYKR